MSGEHSTRRQIAQMLAAKRVAVVGASNDERKVGYRPVQFLTAYGFSGQVYPVNPRLEECCGLRCYPSLAALPERPDLVVVVVNARAALVVVEEAGSLGIPSTVVLSSGFAEVGDEGRRLQTELAQAAKRAGIAMCGPNSVGVVHTPTNLVATFSEALTRGGVPAGSLGVVSQSGAYGTILLAEARARGIGIRTYVSTGNEALLTMGDYLGALVEDPAVRTIGGYVEGIADAPTFTASLDEALAAAKPMVLLKAGRSRHGSAAAASHTGALAGRDEAYEAVFKRFGVVRARTDAEFIDILEAFDTTPNLPSGPKVAVVTMSGGAGVLMADLLDDAELQLASLSEDTRRDLRAILPSYGSVANPVDLTGQFVTNGEGLTEVLRTVGADPGVDLVLVYGGLAWKTDEQWLEAVRALAQDGTCVLAVRPLADTAAHGRFRAAGVPLYPSATAAVRAAQALVGWAEARARQCRPLGQEDGADARIPAGVEPAWLAALGPAEGVVSEAQAKEVLAQLGLEVPTGASARSPEEAQAIAARLGGPVVLKIDAPGILHKTEIGGVRVGVAPAEVAGVFAELVERAVAEGHDRAALGVRVEQMVAGGVEFIVGALQADPFGAMVAVGLGGTASELLGDVAFEVVPVTPALAAEMVASLRVAALLRGYRGSPALDTDALVTAICRVSELAEGLGSRLVELDCNPVLVRPAGQGAVVLDAALVLAAGAGSKGAPARVEEVEQGEVQTGASPHGDPSQQARGRRISTAPTRAGEQGRE